MSRTPPTPAPDGPRGPDATPPLEGRRPTWIVAVVALAVLAYIGVNALRTEGPGSTGPEVGARLPPFAAPLAVSTLEGDANVATARDQGDAGAVPACSVDDPRALNVCALSRTAPVVLAFVSVGSDRCTRALDAIERVGAAFPRVRFAAVAIKGSRERLRELVRERRWTFPVAHDRDGAVANSYGIAVCPTVVFARPGGVVSETAIGDGAASPSALTARVRALERASTAELPSR